MQLLIVQRPLEKIIENMSCEEAEIMCNHFLYLQEKLREGKLITAGPATTGEFGLSIVETETEEEAREIMNNDPAVLSGIMTPTMYPYRVSLLRGRDD